MKVEKFEIEKLWGLRSYTIPIRDNKMIVVAENGAGKTVLLKIIAYFLAKKWDKLDSFQFESVSATIDGKVYKVEKTKLSVRLTDADVQKIADKFPFSADFIQNTLKSLFENNPIAKLTDERNIRVFAEEHDISYLTLADIIDYAAGLVVHGYNDFGYQIPVLYLPTYRRVEQDFGNIVNAWAYTPAQKEETDPVQSEEGYPDISILHDEFLNKDNLANSTYADEPENSPERLVQVWGELMQSHWEAEPDGDFLEIAEFGFKDVPFKLKEKDWLEGAFKKQAPAFLKTCNQYLSTKQLVPANGKIEVAINNVAGTFDMEAAGVLSSGEKQIIALFYYLKTGAAPYFVIIDEPELSISIRWQKRILDDILDSGCIGLLVATHSGSILKNHQEYATSLDALLVGEQTENF